MPVVRKNPIRFTLTDAVARSTGFGPELARPRDPTDPRTDQRWHSYGTVIAPPVGLLAQVAQRGSDWGSARHARHHGMQVICVT
jgi:hypothetical protein